MASKPFSNKPAPPVSRIAPPKRERPLDTVLSGLLVARAAEPQTAVEATLAERGNRYGDFTDHARVCQALKRTAYGAPRASAMNDVQWQAMDVLLDKVARIVCGDPNYADNWHDIQGYAKLVEDRLED